MANLGPTTQAENNSLERKCALVLRVLPCISYYDLQDDAIGALVPTVMLFHRGISRWWSVFHYLKISVSILIY